jgi:hypothetical protein
MLLGLWILRQGFNGTRDRLWWAIAIGIQFFHHFEHLLLQNRRDFAVALSRSQPTAERREAWRTLGAIGLADRKGKAASIRRLSPCSKTGYQAT